MKYGICNLSIVPMRLDPTDKSEMTNQLLFGEQYQILEERRKFSKICLSHDKYEGWICNKQVVQVDKNYYRSLLNDDKNYTKDILDTVKSDVVQPVIIGSVLPKIDDSRFMLNNVRYHFTGLISPDSKDKNMIIENSMIYLNAPYLWGGRTPFGIDCSGFTQMVYRLQGIDLPRDAHQQSKIGTTLSCIEKSESGDLAFFDNNDGKIIHVGIVIENNQIIHSSGKVRIDRIDGQGIFNDEKGTYTHNLRLIKRMC